MQHCGREVSSKFFFSFTHLPKNLHTPTYTYIMYTRTQSIPRNQVRSHSHTIITRMSSNTHAHNTIARQVTHVPFTTFTQYQLLTLYRFSYREIGELKKKKKTKKKKHPPRNSLSSEWSVKRRKARSLRLPTVGSAYIFPPPHVSECSTYKNKAASRMKFHASRLVNVKPSPKPLVSKFRVLNHNLAVLLAK